MKKGRGWSIFNKKQHSVFWLIQHFAIFVCMLLIGDFIYTEVQRGWVLHVIGSDIQSVSENPTYLPR